MLITNKQILASAMAGKYAVEAFNIDTDLRLVFKATLREVLSTSPNEFDPRKILGSAKEAMKKVVKSMMRLFGSSGKAKLG